MLLPEALGMNMDFSALSSVLALGELRAVSEKLGISASITSSPASRDPVSDSLLSQLPPAASSHLRVKRWRWDGTALSSRGVKGDGCLVVNADCDWLTASMLLAA
jgi:hypothetical protein